MKEKKVTCCGNCIEDKEPMFRLVRYHEKRSYSVYFCSYECLVYDVLSACMDVDKNLYEELQDIVCNKLSDNDSN